MEPSPSDEIRANYLDKIHTDPAFRASLLQNSHAALAAIGMTVPTGVTVRVVENDDRTLHIVLPAAPAKVEIDDHALDTVAAGLVSAAVFTIAAFGTGMTGWTPFTGYGFGIGEDLRSRP